MIPLVSLGVGVRDTGNQCTLGRKFAQHSYRRLLNLFNLLSVSFPGRKMSRGTWRRGMKFSFDPFIVHLPIGCGHLLALNHQLFPCFISVFNCCVLVNASPLHLGRRDYWCHAADSPSCHHQSSTPPWTSALLQAVLSLEHISHKEVSWTLKQCFWRVVQLVYEGLEEMKSFPLWHFHSTVIPGPRVGSGDSCIFPCWPWVRHWLWTMWSDPRVTHSLGSHPIY